MKTYHAQVSRDGRFWLIAVPEIDRVTQARRFSEVEPMARDLIEVMDGLPSGGYQLSVDVRLPDSVREHLTRADELRARAKQATSDAAKESRSAVRELVATGLSQREAAKVLGVSFQRVNQLLAG